MTSGRLFRRARRMVLALTVVAAPLIATSAPAHAAGTINCPQALLSFNWQAGEGIGTSHPITMSLSQCAIGARSSALAYGSGTITSTIGTGIFTNNNFVIHHHVTLTVTVPDLAQGPASATRSFDVEAIYGTGVNGVPSNLYHYSGSGPLLQGILPVGWWTELTTFTYPNGHTTVEASFSI